MLSTVDLHQQIFDAIEKGDINQLKVLIEPPATVNTIVCFLLFFI